eukprot:m.175295 g.175295  ORF g.175295 m.175295 type:complete len:467 (+) comp14888_c0_seq1:39-1439(+)
MLVDDEDAELRAAILLSMQVDEPNGGNETDAGGEGAAAAAAEARPAAVGAVRPEDGDLMERINGVCWGEQAANPSAALLEVQSRWCQGFRFVDSEPAALKQEAGGPCGIIGPVQAFLLRRLIYVPREGTDGKAINWRSPPDIDLYLIDALLDILTQCGAELARPVVLATIAEGKEVRSVADLHSAVRFDPYDDRASASTALRASLEQYNGEYGVLLFLYSAVATRGVEAVEGDQGLELDALISLPFGHANQSLVNLMLVGAAVQHVHDGVQDVGVPLRGVSAQPEIGYLTILEQLRYVSVGSFLKNPRHPIWLLGSETHFTVLFSLDARLTAGEGPVTRAKRVFGEHDAAGGGFIMPDKVPLVLRELGIERTPAEMAALIARLGGDVVLLSTFLDVLYPGASADETPANFVVYHYNGIASPGAVVRFTRGQAKSSAPRDFGASPVLRVLRTKWSALEVDFDAEVKI